MKKHALFPLAISLGSLLGTTVVSAQDSPERKPYPLKTCVVSGEKLGSMGKSYVHTYEGHEVQFCCKGCLKDFNKDPQKYLKKLEPAPEKPKS